MSRAMGQNSLTPKGNNNFNFQLACDQVVQLKTPFKVKYFLIVEQERKRKEKKEKEARRTNLNANNIILK